MKGTIKSFAKSLTVYTVVILLISFALYWWVPLIPVTPSFPFVVTLMYALTLIILWVLGKSMENRMSRFANTFMLVNFGKLILYVIVIFVYAILNREDAVGFILAFFIYYLLFTAFEIVVLLRLNK